MLSTYSLLAILATIGAGVYVYFKLVVAQYWKKRNIPCLEPLFLLGNFYKANFTQSFGDVLSQAYRENKKFKVVGTWLFQTPMLIPIDVEIVKNILVKDFNYFHDRGIDINEEVEPLSGHLFNMSGTKWRNLRVKLTPTFTSGKMKMMFPTIVDCGAQLQAFLQDTVKDGRVVEIKDIMGRFTTDTISSCAFGIQSNSLKNPDSEFRTYGKQIFEPTLYLLLTTLLAFAFPIIDKIFWFRRLPKGVSDFFLKAVKDTIEYRELNNTQRKDFLQLLIELKNKGKIEDADYKYQENKTEAHDDTFTIEQAAAQAFVFFLAGFETSSTTIMFTFYELAQNAQIQEKLQEEIDEVLQANEGKLTYEGITEMPYLDRVIAETLRKYPPVPALFRVCTKDYKIPELNSTISKGTPIFIPINAIQMDPDIYPEPDRFDPDRFTPEEKAKRDAFAYLPFGEGPRVCIGTRFGLLQSKIGLISILSKFTVQVAESTPIPIKYNVKSFVPTPNGGMPLRLVPRQ